MGLELFYIVLFRKASEETDIITKIYVHLHPCCFTSLWYKLAYCCNIIINL